MNHNLFENVDWTLLREQKQELESLWLTEHLLSPKQYDALQGVINILDTIQDYAVDVEGVEETKVFNFKTEEI